MTRNKESKMHFSAILVVLSVVIAITVCENKYSEQVNTKIEDADDPKSLRFGDNPYRMQKINLIWTKARKRLADDKLKALYSELKIQDKEELQWKRMKAEGQDKDGLKEAELRRRLKGIMNRFDLGENMDAGMGQDASQKHNRATNEIDEKRFQKMTFADKKLNKLWEKAERSGFTEDELKTLKEEFQHHQEKVNEYYEIMDKAAVDDGKGLDNSVDQFKNDFGKDMTDPKQLLKEKHRELKQNYERLGEMAAVGVPGRDFSESRVSELWSLAKKANFSPDELESLREELQHFEHRVRKLLHLQAEADAVEINGKIADDLESRKRADQKLKKYSLKVDQLHEDIQSRIMQRRLEL